MTGTDLCVNKPQSVPVIIEPPCIKVKVKVKVKFTLVHALRLCTGRMAYMRSRGIALPSFDNGTRMG